MENAVAAEVWKKFKPTAPMTAIMTAATHAAMKLRISALHLGTISTRLSIAEIAPKGSEENTAGCRATAARPCWPNAGRKIILCR